MLLQISSGRGPAECELAVGLFLVALKSELGGYEILDEECGRYGGSYKSVLIKTDFSDAAVLTGTVQWISKSPYRPNHKRKNWFIGVKQIPEIGDCTYETGLSGVVYQTFRSGGKGGQHVNKTDSAVRAIHTATGLSAVSRDERSQFLNKKTALERLKKLLEQSDHDKRFDAKQELNHNHNFLERGNPIRIYEGTVFKRVL